MPNRTIAPAFVVPEQVKIQEARKEYLENGIPLFVIDAGDQDLIRIDFMFPAGFWFQPHKWVAGATTSMMYEGTLSKTALQISEAIDYYGAFTDHSTNTDFSYLTIFCLNKHLENVLPIMKEVLTECIFPEDELEAKKQRKKQQLEVNLQKNNTLALREFKEAVFGKNHPYGYKIIGEDYDRVSRQDLVEFHKNHFNLNKCKIIAAGKVTPNEIGIINQVFGKEKVGIITKFYFGENDCYPEKDKTRFVQKSDSLQASIYIGRKLFKRNHQDFYGMLLLNKVLGGYFGSRLMSNLREDKGYTYGIHSSVRAYRNDGFFYIHTEVNNDNWKEAVNEIYHEIDKLRSESIGTEELQIVKNYTMGQFVRSLDGAFSLADSFITIYENDLDYSYYYDYFDKIKNISPYEIMQLANKYLSKEDLFEVVCGNNE